MVAKASKRSPTASQSQSAVKDSSFSIQLVTWPYLNTHIQQKHYSLLCRAQFSGINSLKQVVSVSNVASNKCSIWIKIIFRKRSLFYYNHTSLQEMENTFTHIKVLFGCEKPTSPGSIKMSIVEFELGSCRVCTQLASEHKPLYPV